MSLEVKIVEKWNKEKVINWRIVCTAIVCLAGLEAYALSKGFNGTLLKIVIAVIAGLAGLVIPSPIKIKNGSSD